MPIIGPVSYEEAMERINNGVSEMESGGGYSWEEVKTVTQRNRPFRALG